MIEAAPTDFSLFEQVDLKTTHVFGCGRLQRLAEKLGESSHVIGVGIDGRLGLVADLHVLGHPFGDRRESLLIGSHAERL